jgi:hypothetical protein
MEGMRELAIGIVVVLFLLIPLWVTVIAGLVHIVRDKIREKRFRRERPQLPTRIGW